MADEILRRTYPRRPKFKFAGDGGRVLEYNLTRIGPGGTAPTDPEPPPPPPPPPPDPPQVKFGSDNMLGLDRMVSVTRSEDEVPPPPPPPPSTDVYTFGMSAAEIRARPRNNSRWTYLEGIARGSWPAPALSNQDATHNMHCFAAGLVYVATGDETMRTKARNGIMAAIGTFSSGGGSGLNIARQVGGYVHAADLINLGAADRADFEDFLVHMLTGNPTRIGTHSQWGISLRVSHDVSPNNHGAFHGQSRIAADIYIGDLADLAKAANTTMGFLGDRTKWARFRDQLGNAPSDVASWMVDPNPSTGATPVNPAGTKFGVTIDGVIPADYSREANTLTSSSGWPNPDAHGVTYTQETLQGVAMQLEMLRTHGYPTIFSASNSALRRMADVVSRHAAAGGQPGWNPGRVQKWIPWFLNARYGAGRYPTVPAEYGRAFGFSDFLYGP